MIERAQPEIVPDEPVAAPPPGRRMTLRLSQVAWANWREFDERFTKYVQRAVPEYERGTSERSVSLDGETYELVAAAAARAELTINKFIERILTDGGLTPESKVQDFKDLIGTGIIKKPYQDGDVRADQFGAMWVRRNDNWVQISSVKGFNVTTGPIGATVNDPTDEELEKLRESEKKFAQVYSGSINWTTASNVTPPQTTTTSLTLSSSPLNDQHARMYFSKGDGMAVGGVSETNHWNGRLAWMISQDTWKRYIMISIDGSWRQLSRDFEDHCHVEVIKPTKASEMLGLTFKTDIVVDFWIHQNGEIEGPICTYGDLPSPKNVKKKKGNSFTSITNA